MPAGAPAWLAIALFGLIDASCFQVQTTALHLIKCTPNYSSVAHENFRVDSKGKAWPRGIM